MSTKLSEKKCVPCEGGIQPMTPEEIMKYLPQLERKWDVVDNKKITHTFKFKDFKEAVSFVNKVAHLAESQGHHPNIHIYYNRVKIVLYTHAINGLFQNDFILAAKIEQLV
ncbi:4a-hydroxytetrahydrobiopterin dehydratase [Candidatus Roizmanbacteria bacterium]|nr:4a-hydroxytetrahydrobiopterin dehydratase [Candidatus Roizmanbacteria bacterium]